MKKFLKIVGCVIGGIFIFLVILAVTLPDTPEKKAENERKITLKIEQDKAKEFKKQMKEKYKDHEIDVIGEKVFVNVGYYKNPNNDNWSFTIYTNSLAENELLQIARKQLHIEFRETRVHFFNEFDKTVDNSRSDIYGGMYLSNYNKEAKFAEYRKSNIKDEFGNIVVKESIFYFKNGNDNTYHERSNYTNGIKDK